MKIAIISDLHLGFKQYGSIERENDFYNQFITVCKEINKHSPEMVIIAGDLFDKPNPSPIAINIYREGILELGSDIICTIKGNHTMILRDNHFSIDDFFGTEELWGYYYLDDASFDSDIFALSEGGDVNFNKYKNSKVHVDGITYRNNTTIDDFIKTQKNMASKCSDEYYNILVVHQSFKEFCGFTGEELSINDIDYSNYDLIICGHIHSRNDSILSDGTIFIQPGSIERMNTTEALDEQKNGKGFYLIDTKDNLFEFYKVDCPRKFFLGDVEIRTKEELENHFNEIEKKTKKLKLAPIISYNYKSYIKNIDEVRKEIDCIKNNVLLNKSNIDDKTEEEIILEIQDTEIPSLLEALKMYGKKSGLNDDECSLSIDLHNSLNNNIESVDEILSVYLEKHKNKIKEIELDEDELKESIEYFGG